MIDLQDIAQRLVAPGKGIYAADESVASADKRLVEHGIKPGSDSRLHFRDLFLGTPRISEYLTGVILHEETLNQNGLDGESFAQKLANQGIMPGIKVDEGTEPMPESPDELITKGLIGLSARLHEYREKRGTTFTKWRAVVKIDGEKLPTDAALIENMKRLAMSARCVQEAGMVPILEPEVLYDGMHARVRSRAVIAKALTILMRELDEHGVDRTGVIVKTAMALSGKATGKMDTPEEVAEDTLSALLEAIPKDVPGIVFLSGGQTPEQSMQNLAAITKEAKAKHAPWPLTFSFSRAFQDEALDIWKGEDANVPEAREAFLKRLKEAKAALS